MELIEDKRVLFVLPGRYHYRESFYSLLSSELKNLNVTIEYMFPFNSEHGRPSLGLDVPSDFLFEGYSIKTLKFGSGFSIVLSFGIARKLMDSRYRALILVGNPSNYSSILLAILAKLMGRKVILWVCSWDNGINKYFAPIKEFTRKRYYSLADLFIAYGTHAKGMIDKSVPNKKVLIAYNGLDIRLHKLSQRFDEVSRRIRDDKQFVILYVGGFLLSKKVELLCQAFVEFNHRHHSKLVLVGDGPELPRLKSIYESENIVFEGRIIDGVDDYFKIADVFVLPGSGGLSLNQAMYWGTPCIVSTGDGTEEDLVLDGFNGFRFKRDSLESLKRAMTKAADLSKEDLDIYGIRSKELIIKQSNVSKMVMVFNKGIVEVL